MESVDSGALGEVGLGVRKERFGLSRQDSRFFGTLDLDTQIADGVHITPGLWNSADKSWRQGSPSARGSWSAP